MKFIIICLFILIGCTTSTSPQKQNDVFDKIFYLKKVNDPKELIPLLGKPEKVDTSDSETDQYYFPKKEAQMPIKAFVNKKTQKITTIALTYWVGFDAYAYLKKRFGKYKWLESRVESKALDVIEELYKVEIPELGMTFQYDNQDPLRRPMWIFFK